MGFILLCMYTVEEIVHVTKGNEHWVQTVN